MTAYRRAVLLVTGSSILVPIIGLATAPILARALGALGRGEVGAALAPNLLIVGGATLGLPPALTYVLAKRPELTRLALACASLLALMAGGLALTVVSFAGSFLANGDEALAELIVLGTWLALPALIVGLLRGAALGRQMWAAVAGERVVNSSLRLLALGGLAVIGRLDVVNAVLVLSLAPIVAGVVYTRIGVLSINAETRTFGSARMVRELFVFGSKEWLGSVALILTARTSQLLVAPLSDVEQLGLLMVAITIADIPYIVTQAVREVTFGTSSAERDDERLAATSRVATLLSLVGSFLIGVTLPIWIGPVFGQDFEAATMATWILLASSCVAVPGIVAGAGLDAAGRPGLRSIALGVALIVNLIGLVVAIPHFGAAGAALAGLVSICLSTTLVIRSASRLLEISGHRFYAPQLDDLTLLRALGSAVFQRVRPGGKR